MWVPGAMGHIPAGTACVTDISPRPGDIIY